MSREVGQSKLRVDAFDKAAGRAKYTDDLCDRAALVTRIVHTSSSATTTATSSP
mgnify:CR=1 FL=1